MNLKIGDLLIFVGNKNLQNNHYDNFEIGKSYKISKLQNIAYDLDDITGYNNECVLFENHTHGCLLNSVGKYFISIEDYRNKKINKIIE